MPTDPRFRLSVSLSLTVTVRGRWWEIEELPNNVVGWRHLVLAEDKPEGESWIFFLDGCVENEMEKPLYAECFPIPLAKPAP